MGTKVTPPQENSAQEKASKLLGKILILVGVILIFFSIWQLIKRIPAITSSKVQAPQLLSQTPIYSTSEEITIKGKTKPKANVLIFENNTQITEAKADSDGYFTTLLRLKEGKHELALQTQTQILFLKLRSKEKTPLLVVVDKTAPEVSKVTSKVSKDKIYISGEVTEDSVLVVQNESTRIVEKNIAKGPFKIAIGLKNLKTPNLYIFAIDKSGNISKAAKLHLNINLDKIQKTQKGGTLPNSAGSLEDALKVFGRNVIALGYLSVVASVYLAVSAATNLLKRVHKN